MLLAEKLNGLVGDDLKPWHLKVTYALFDEKGKESGRGTYEEYWASPGMRKTILTSPAYQQTVYFTKKGAFLVGQSDQSQFPLVRGLNAFTKPIGATPDFIAHWILERKEHSAGDVRLVCVLNNGLSTLRGPVSSQGAAYCMDSDRPALFSIENRMNQSIVLFRNITVWQGHYLPTDVEIQKNGAVLFRAHLVAKETLEQVNDADFTPPPGAVAETARSGIEPTKAINFVPPEYPVQARNAGVSGTVVLRMVIGKDGRIQNPQVVSGPDMFRSATLDAVRQWRYKPYLQHGKPVELMMTVNVKFEIRPDADWAGRAHVDVSTMVEVKPEP